jgi:hypothetical protein
MQTGLLMGSFGYWNQIWTGLKLSHTGVPTVANQPLFQLAEYTPLLNLTNSYNDPECIMKAFAITKITESNFFSGLFPKYRQDSSQGPVPGLLNLRRHPLIPSVT